VLKKASDEKIATKRASGLKIVHQLQVENGFDAGTQYC